MKKKITKLSIILILLFITQFCFLLLIILTKALDISWYSKEIFRSCQPAEIDYQSFDPYCSYIIKRYHVIDSHYEIIVGQKVDEGKLPDMGHFAYLMDQDLYGEEIQNYSVEWNDLGLTLKDRFGRELFIPKKLFIEGR